VTTHTADIDYQTIIVYTGGYDDMVLAKTQIRSRLESQNAQREKKIEQLNEFIARFSAGTRSSQVMSRKKEVERLQTSDLARSNIARPFIRFDMKRPSGRHALEVKGISKSYAEHKVIENFTASIARGEKVGILGRNGAGKTTLLRSIIANGTGAHDEPFFLDAGTTEWGHEVAIGYFAQDHRANIQPGMAILDWLQQYDPTAGNEELRGLLGQMLFARDEAMKPTQALSGGEAARLIFCRMMLQKPNVLVLDEPTNHLDIESIEGLLDGLKLFQGTVVVVSHDRHFVSDLATRVIELRPGEVKDFSGSYEEYLERHGQDYMRK
jgi:ATPase subunit of ABC transporter with duplicated ATPase domains